MLFYVFLVYFVLNLDVVICTKETLQTLSITLCSIGQNCCISSNHHFFNGDTVQFNIQNNMIQKNKKSPYIINDSNWYINNLKQPNNKLKKFVLDHTMVNNFSGIWRFEFLYLKDGPHISYLDFITYEGHNYTRSVCSTNVVIANKTVTPSKNIISELDEKWIIIASIIIVFIAFVIISQCAAIVYYRSKVRKLNTHSNLVQLSNGKCQDNDRYSTNPTRKNKPIAPPTSYFRNSEIYEAPDIALAGLSTPPNLPSQDTLARRPPLPLPTNEHYSDAIEENIYEQPVTEAQTTKEPPHKLFGQQRPDVPKPVIRPKDPHLQSLKPTKHSITQSKPTLPKNKVSDSKPTLTRSNESKPTLPRNINELKQILHKKPELKPISARNQEERRPKLPRNGAVQLPVRSIPGPSTLKSTPKPKPPNATPKTPMTTPKNQQAKLLENHQATHNGDSSDEDWTYEALPQFNIYSI